MTAPVTPDQAPEEGTEPVDPKTLTAVRELIGFMFRTIKTMRLYDNANPTYQKALADIGERFRGFVDTYGSLTLRLERDKIMWGQEALYQDDDPKEGLAFRLYSDGVRQLVFKDGVPEGEVGQAVKILAEGASLRSADDDFVTLIWNADLSHVDVVAVEDDIPTQVLTPMLHRENATPVEEIANVARLQMSQETEPQKVAFGSDVLSAFRLSQEEGAYLKDLTLREAAVDSVLDLIGILGDVLMIEQDPVEFVETVTLYAGLMRDFLSRGRLAIAAAQVQIIKNLPARRGDLTPEMQHSIQAVVSGLTGATMLGALKEAVSIAFAEAEGEDVDQMEVDREKRAEELQAYLSHLEAGDPRPLLEMAAGIPHPRTREIICQHAARICSKDHSPVTDLLLEREPALIQCALMALAALSDPVDLPHFAAVAQHPEAGVRRAALDAICAISGGGHIQVLKYLTDPDERIRRKALSAIESSRFREAAAPLRDLIMSPPFENWELADRRAVFSALGAVGGEREVPFFKEFMVTKRSWLGGGKEDDGALCAVAGLKNAGGDAARALLKDALKHADPRVASAAQKALAGFGKAT